MNKEMLRLSMLSLGIALALLATGCSSLWPFGRDAKTQPEKSSEEKKDDLLRYSENANVPNISNKNYRRMTRQRLEEDSELQAQAGSTWVMEGQGAYLFAQNKTRKEGDLLNVKLEGSAQKQIETKVSVIKLLLKQLEDEELKQKMQAEPKADVEAPKLSEETDKKKSDSRKPASIAAAGAPEAAKKEDALGIDIVPTKIIERLPDGNYRVKGQQPFMIGQREYKVLVTGLVRPEDFNDEGLSSEKIMDPQYDVVSLRRKESR
jgi:flagellar L-ring protein FlgH